MTDDNAPAWPDPERPGVPLNPERDGAHWIIGWNNSPFVAEWQADPNAESGGDYGWYDGGDRPDGIIANGWTYGGPCLTPSEVAAREAAAAAAMRAACADWHEAQALQLEHSSAKNGTIPKEWILHHRSDASSIRALPLPPMPGTTQGGSADE